MTTTPTYFTVVADFKSVVVDLASDVDADPTLGPISAKVTFTPLLQAGGVILATDASPRPTGFLPAPIVSRIDVDGRLKLRVEPDGDRDDFVTLAAFPGTGTIAKVYFAIDTQTFYRWNSSTYVETYPYAPVRLLADTDLLELSSELYYRVSFSDVVYNGTSQYIAPFTFQAPNTDTEINLITVMRHPGQPAASDPLTVRRAIELIRAQTPAIVDADLAARQLALEDIGDGGVQFTLGGDPLGDPLTLPGAAWSNIAGRPQFSADSALEVLIGRMAVEPDLARRELMRVLISDLMVAGVWDNLDGLYVFAAHDRQAALLNWIPPGGNPIPPSSTYTSWRVPSMRDCTEVNAPTFTVDQGFTGDGIGSYIDTNTPGRELLRATVDDASAGVYVRTTVSANFLNDMGAESGFQINTANSSNNLLVYPMGGFISPAPANPSPRLGLHAFTRSGSSATAYKAGLVLGSGSPTGITAMPAGTVQFLRYRNDYSPRQVAAGFMGAGLTDEQHFDVHVALMQFLTQIGAAV